MKITGICFTRSGMELARRMESWFSMENQEHAADYEAEWFCKGKVFTDYPADGFTYLEGSLKEWAGEHFTSSDAMIFIGATGICVRTIAPYVSSKKTDPAVIVFDEQGTFGISLLSGHIGGANELTEKLCAALESTPVVTTATDVNHKFAVDVFATQHHLSISSMEEAKAVSAAIVSGETVPVSADVPIRGNAPGGIRFVTGFGKNDDDERDSEIGIHISPFYREKPFEHTLYLIPKCMTIGIGCKRNTPVEKIEDLVENTLKERRIFPEALTSVATIDLKKDEPGLLEFCKKHDLPLHVFSAEELKKAEGAFSASSFVSSITGVDNVCERSAVLQGGGTLIINKLKGDGVTCAVTLQDWSVEF